MPSRFASLGVLAGLLAAALCGPARSQVLTVPAESAQPGAIVPVTVLNDTAEAIVFQPACALRILRGQTGEDTGFPYIDPADCGPVMTLTPGHQMVIDIVAPMEAGSYVVLFLPGKRAVVRLNVVFNDSQVRKLCMFPAGLDKPESAHQVDFADPSTTRWQIGNVGVAHVFNPGTFVRVRAPGLPDLLATLPLQGVAVASGGVTDIVLPIGALPPASYIVEAYYDSSELVRVRGGIHPLGARVDMHLPEGHILKPGKHVRAAVTVTGFSPQPGDPPWVVLLVGLLPGSFTLPDGTVVPLNFGDGLVSDSIGGLYGLLSSNLGPVQTLHEASDPQGYVGVKDDILLKHPGPASLSGIELHVAAVAFDLQLTTFGSSQAEPIVIN